jgi:hypothetical protein
MKNDGLPVNSANLLRLAGCQSDSSVNNAKHKQVATRSFRNLRVDDIIASSMDQVEMKSVSGRKCELFMRLECGMCPSRDEHRNVSGYLQ